MTISIMKILLVLVILSVMIIILVTMNHFLVGSFNSDDDDIESLRHEIDDQKEVITDKSSFRELVGKENRE